MPAKSNNNNPLQQTFEALDKVSGGVASQVKDTVVESATESVKQIASSPLEILQSLIGTGDSSAESSTSGTDPNDPNGGQSTEFTKKLEEDRAKREALLRQHRSVLQQYEQAFKQKQAQEEQMQQMQEHQEEQQKEEKKFIEQKQRQDPRWMQALKGKMGPGKGEVGKGGN